MVKKVFNYVLNPYAKMASECLIHECLKGIHSPLHWTIPYSAYVEMIQEDSSQLV